MSEILDSDLKKYLKEGTNKFYKIDKAILDTEKGVKLLTKYIDNVKIYYQLIDEIVSGNYTNINEFDNYGKSLFLTFEDEGDFIVTHSFTYSSDLLKIKINNQVSFLKEFGIDLFCADQGYLNSQLRIFVPEFDELKDSIFYSRLKEVECFNLYKTILKYYK